MAMAILNAVTLYLEVGAFVALLLALSLGYYDAAARGSYAFRLLLLPGLILLWPVVLARLVALRSRRLS